MKRFLMIFMCVMLTVMANAQVKVVQKNRLPKSVINFIETNYSEREVMTYQIDYSNYNFKHIDDYEVLYENGTKLEFLKDGKFKSIDCGRLDYVKWHILPEEITYFIRRRFPRHFVVEYSIEYKWNKANEFELKLNNGLKLTFNKKYKLIELD